MVQCHNQTQLTVEIHFGFLLKVDEADRERKLDITVHLWQQEQKAEKPYTNSQNKQRN